MKFSIREEYAIEYLEQIQQQYVKLCGFDPKASVRGRGHHKTIEQRHYDKLSEYISRLKKYAEHIKICLLLPPHLQYQIFYFSIIQYYRLLY